MLEGKHNGHLQKGYLKDSESDAFFTDVISEESSVLDKLLQEIQPVDFKAEAFPDYKEKNDRLNEVVDTLAKGNSLTEQQKTDLDDERQKLFKAIEKMKITEKHILIIAIEKIVEVAHLHNLGLCRHLDFIYVYNGTFWKAIDEQDFKKFLGLAALKMRVDKFTSKHYEFKDKLFKQFISDAYLPAPEQQEDTVLINLKNGTFEVTSNGNQLRPFERADFLKYQLAFDYEPTATAPRFQKFLDEVLPDTALQNVLSEYLGYLFIKPSALKLEKVLLLYGTGANGKSVVFEIVSALVGKENISSYSLHSLTDQAGYYRAQIANKLVNYATEVNGLTRTDIFKALASGEPMEARQPYGRAMTVENYAKFIFNCNELPKEVEHSHGFFRRFMIIPFQVTIPDKEQDKKLPEKIIRMELAGVFNWILEGLQRLLEREDFTDAAACNRMLDDYKKESDSVQMFLEDYNYKKSIGVWLELKSFYADYKAYCIEDGCRPISKKNMKKRLISQGFEIVKKNVGLVIYVEVRPEEEPIDSATTEDIF
jgi:putative DNA primase/helicase